MAKQLILKGIAQYVRLGAKTDRYKIVIDDVKFSEEINTAREKEKKSPKVKLPSIQDMIRKKNVELWLV